MFKDEDWDKELTLGIRTITSSSRGEVREILTDTNVFDGSRGDRVTDSGESTCEVILERSESFRRSLSLRRIAGSAPRDLASAVGKCSHVRARDQWRSSVEGELTRRNVSRLATLRIAD